MIVEEAVDTAADGLAVLEGEEKKEVMVALAFGFLAAVVAMSPALRLRGVAMVRTICKSRLTGREEVDEIGNRFTLSTFDAALRDALNALVSLIRKPALNL